MPDMSYPEITPFEARTTEIDGLYVLRMKQITDERGTVREFYRESAFQDAGLPSLGSWVQINVTETGRGAIRGLHGEDMVKLVGIAHGEAFGAYVDARDESPTRGNTVTVRLTQGTQVLVPAGVCNGFQSVSPGVTQYLYCFTSEWKVGMAGMTANALDPGLEINWPMPVDVADPAQLSAKDRDLPHFCRGIGPFAIANYLA
jgi:dTDP-4-dehydrorhamnose 3,5-epimerase